ncbi:MAG: acyltransferase [Bacteroidaceae bacterium]|nr:acyltransferase [Bacteroidaceae bacterium]
MLYTINNSEIKGGPSQRICGLDLIRVCAIFFVIAGHFLFVNTAYTETPIQSISVFLQRMMMSVFYVSVPLFMMLTGYLNTNKTPTIKYYKGMLRVLVAYLVFSIVTILFRICYLGEDRSIIQWVLSIFDYSAIKYAWYIEMWIGLALIAPFLNYMWHAIPTMREKLLLIAVLFLLVSFPDTVNSRVYLFPGYFEKGCYPLMFYFMGTFIREYQPTIKTWLGLAIILLISMVNPIATLILAGSESTDYSLGGGPKGVLCTCIAVAIFLMLYRREVSVKPVKRWVTHCSMVSLEMYLCCYMFDQLYYPWFKERFYESQAQFLPWFLVIVPAVFLSSYIVASAYNFIAVKMRR